MANAKAVTASALALFVAALAGCGADGGLDLPTQTIQGQVTQNTQPVPEGSVLLLESSEVGVSREATIQANGRYEIEDMPVGTYTVSIGPPAAAAESEMTPEEYDKMMSGQAPPPTTPADFPVPEKYRKTGTSDKTVEVRAGEQQIDIAFEG